MNERHKPQPGDAPSSNPNPARESGTFADAKTTLARRDFLAKLGLSSLGCATLLPAAGNALANPAGPVADKLSIHKWGMAINVEACIGCGACVRACAAENDVPPDHYRTWVERYREFEDGVVVDAPHGGINGYSGEEDKREPEKAFFVPKLCNACQKSPCVQVCPVGATFETPDGAVLVDKSYCIGCRYCIQACPYGCRFLNPVTKVADKCTFCYHRIHKGLKPACVEACPTNARIFGDLNDPKDELTVFLREHMTDVLKPHLNTYPKVFYNGINHEVR